MRRHTTAAHLTGPWLRYLVPAAEYGVAQMMRDRMPKIIFITQSLPQCAKIFVCMAGVAMNGIAVGPTHLLPPFILENEGCAYLWE
jgi:hypothetical protein